MSHGLLLVLLLVALLVGVPIYFYNRLVVLRNRCKESWANVETELKRRYDLIPNLVATVKGYAAHERELLDRIVALRNQAVGNHGRPADQEADRIQAARRFYNANVRDYRDTMRTFPGNVFAQSFGFEQLEFFEIDPVEVQAPTVALGAA